MRVEGDIRSDDGRDLVYRGLSISGKLPRPALEAVMIEEFRRQDSAGVRKLDWLR